MITIRRLAKQVRLSRSTLLYYDRIGLLRPSGRSAANYRLYSRADQQRLKAICRYREMGLSLAAIRRILDHPRSGTPQALERRLLEIDRQMQALRRQQRIIRNLLERASPEASEEGLTRAKWTALLRAAGMSDDDMLQWHREFERLFPLDHRAFLESLGIEPGDIAALRTLARRTGPE